MMINELERFQKGSVPGRIKVLFWNFPGGTEQNVENSHSR
jgi:hypothetical protein